MNVKSWSRLVEACQFYADRGVIYKEVPWAVSTAVSNITKPAGCQDFYLRDKVLVGSAEQSFLEKYLTLEDGKFYYALTPCFRDEIEDEWHQPYFMKVEIFSTNPNCVSYIAFLAMEFFSRQLGGKEGLELEWFSDSSADITYKGIELGSYYSREFDYFRWSCGTGLAEPRFSQALQTT